MAFVRLRGFMGGGADVVYGFHTVAGILNTVAPTSQDFLVAYRVQVRKAAGELDCFAFAGDGTIGWLFAFYALRQIVRVDREEPGHPGFFVFQIAGGLVFVGVVQHALLQVAEDEVQHIEEVDADVGGHAEGLAGVAFPALHVPLAP